MVRRSILIAVVAWGGLSVVAPASAQDTETPNRLPTLSERLEQFRQDLIGGEPRPSQPQAATAPSQPTNNSGFQFGADRKVSGRVTPPAPAAKPPQQASPGLLSPMQSSQVQTNPFVQPGQQAQNRPQQAGPQQLPAPTRTQAPPAQAKAPGAAQTPGARPQLETQTARKAAPSGAPGAADLKPINRSAPDASEGTAAKREAASRTGPQVPHSEILEDPLGTGLAPSEPRMASRSKTTETAPSVSRPRELPAKEKDAEEPTLARERPGAGGDGILFSAQSPVISIETTGPKKIMIGKEAQFVIKVRNSGAAANNVVVTMDVPSEAEVTGAQGTAGSTSSVTAGERREPLEWRISRLEAKSSETLTLRVVPRKSTPLDLAVRWTFTPEASQTLVEVQEPKLQMSITGPEEVRYGQSKIYKLTVSNPGNGDTENVVVALLPVGRASDGIASHRMGTLKAGETRAIDIELTARQAGVLSIKAQAYADGGLRTEAAEQVLVRRASLQMEVESPKVKYAGTVGTYKVKIVNAGNDTAENVQITALLPPDSKYVSSSAGGRSEAQQGKVNWGLGSLPPGSERTLELQCSLAAPGDNRMQFMSVAEGDLSAQTTANTRVEALADLKLEVRDPQGPIAVGEATVYEVHIRNRGTKAAEQVELTVFFSEGLEATSAEGGLHDIGVGQVVFRPIGVIGPGETTIIRVHARADRAGSHVFRAEVVCQSLKTRLAAEEATHFYGDDAVVAQRESSPLHPHTAQEPTPIPPIDATPPAGLTPFNPFGD